MPKKLSLAELARIARAMRSDARSAEYAAEWTDIPANERKFTSKAKRLRRRQRLAEQGIERRLKGR